MKSPLTNYLKWPLIIFLVFIFTVTIAFTIRFDPLNLSSPTDEYLITLLNSEREQFESLRHQYVLSSNQSGTTRGHGLELQNIHPAIPSLLTVGGDENGLIRFVFAEGNILAVGAGWAKGLEYVPADNVEGAIPKESLNQAYRLPPGLYTRRIDSHWFIFYQKDE